jgi:DNA-binding CsgD family transcriptional regulator
VGGWALTGSDFAWLEPEMPIRVALISTSTVSSVRAGDGEAMRKSLTPRELEVLRLMAVGVKSRNIAEQLGISYFTVRSHVRSIDDKLGAHSKLESVVTAWELELVN